MCADSSPSFVTDSGMIINATVIRRLRDVGLESLASYYSVMYELYFDE